MVRTPGHAVVNLVVLGTLAATGSPAAVVAGAVLPDLPIMALWALERWRGRPEEDIWRSVYPTRPWVDLIHGAHSIPLASLGLVVAALLGAPSGVAFFASALLHSLLDLPLHAEDAHRHFLPFSSWRFVSSLSYWDPRYHAAAVTLVEALVVLGACAWLWTGASTAGRGGLLAIGMWYGLSCWRMVFAAERAPA